jgi:hypothetical protein
LESTCQVNEKSMVYRFFMKVIPLDCRFVVLVGGSTNKRFEIGQNHYGQGEEEKEADVSENSLCIVDTVM